MTRILSYSILSIASLACILGLFGCDIDDENASHNLQVNDLSISVLENPALDEELGQVIASAEGALLEFEVISSEPAGAFVMESSTGVVKVASTEHFDFEARESLTAVVRVSAGDESRDANVLVQLEDELADPASFNMFTKNWVTAKFSFNGIFSSMDIHACRLDDEMRLSGTGNYTYDGGNDLCGNEDNQQLKTGTWDLDEKLEFILFDKGDENEIKVEIDFFEPGKLFLSGSYMGIPISGEYLEE